LLGCGDQHASQFEEQDNPPELTDSTASALGYSCANAQADASGSGFFRYTSPHSYSNANCFKGVVVDYEADIISSSGGGAPPNSAVLGWADTVPTTQSECESARVSGYRFARNGGATWVGVESGVATGVWRSWGICETPRVFFTGIAPEVRIAGNARKSAATSAPTRSLSIIFTPPQPQP